MQKTNFRRQFTNAADACALAQSIVDTVRNRSSHPTKGYA